MSSTPDVGEHGAAPRAPQLGILDVAKNASANDPRVTNETAPYRCFRLSGVALTAVLALASFASSAAAQTFSDNFNRADGPVGNEWSTFGAGAVISANR